MFASIHRARAYELPVIRALHSLTPEQASALTDALTAVTADWQFDRHEDYDGHLALLISHRADPVTLIVDHDASGWHLSVLREDRLLPTPGRFPHFDLLLDALRAQLAANAVAPV